MGLVLTLAKIVGIICGVLIMGKINFLTFLYLSHIKGMLSLRPTWSNAYHRKTQISVVVTLVPLHLPTLYDKRGIFTHSPWLWVFCPLSILEKLVTCIYHIPHKMSTFYHSRQRGHVSLKMIFVLMSPLRRFIIRFNRFFM